jgi:hypothetical protein
MYYGCIPGREFRAAELRDAVALLPQGKSKPIKEAFGLESSQ